MTAMGRAGKIDNHHQHPKNHRYILDARPLGYGPFDSSCWQSAFLLVAFFWLILAYLDTRSVYVI